MIINKQEIEREAKEILDKFAKALEKVEKEHDVEEGVDRDEYERLESEKYTSLDDGFKKRILENAPAKNEDFIIAERGSWK